MTVPHGNTKVLVLDDEKLIRLTISAKLKNAGYQPVPVGTVEDAVKVLREGANSFSAIISDIMMGEMDGFVFRDIVRGIDKSMPFFFLTALDPEEGSGFLKRIVEDPLSYYLPKSVSTDVLVNRVKRVVASRRIELFIDRQVEQARQSLSLAAHVQNSMLPQRALMVDRCWYSVWWRPKDVVSGDIVEAVPFGEGSYLFVVGDIQGHGTSAALAMTAVQSSLKNFSHTEAHSLITPIDIANMLQKFFRANLAEVSYMTALICVHNAVKHEVEWLSCGAPDLLVYDDKVKGRVDINPEKRGGLPIGLLPDTVYTQDDVVRTPLGKNAFCVAYTDGILDLACDSEGLDKIQPKFLDKLSYELAAGSFHEGSCVSLPYKFMCACEEYGYKNYQDDVTVVTFGPRRQLRDIYEATFSLSPSAIDSASQAMAAWCRKRGWNMGLIMRLQLVFEEKLMNVYDHGFDDRERLREVASVRVRKEPEGAALTVWDTGTPEPSLSVAAGSTATAFELANMKMSGRGRGRLMVRELCRGIERKRYNYLNETVCHVKGEETGGGGSMTQLLRKEPQVMADGENDGTMKGNGK